MCLKVMPALRGRPRFVSSLAPSLLKLGSWMSVSNLVGPILVNLDRFVLGSVISISVVAFYTVPYEMATKVLLVPGALAGVLFPAFAGSYATDRSRAAGLFTQGMKVTWLVLFPVIVTLVAFAHEALSLWLGAEFGSKSTTVLQWLAVGVLINSLAQVPFALVQAAGRPDLTAKLHLIELPVYLVAMWWLIANYGIQGAAIGWTLRALVDAVALVGMVRHPLGFDLGPLWRLAAISTFGLVSLAVVSGDLHLGARAAIVGVSITLFTVVGWVWLFGPDDRLRMRARIAAIFPRN
jgi:O-antigen/teichoic acid export membrane protein